MANLTLVQAKANLDAASADVARFRIEAEMLERKIKEATKDIEVHKDDRLALAQEIATMEKQLVVEKEKLDKILADPLASAEDKAKAQSDYNRSSARLTSVKDELSAIDIKIKNATKVLADLENSDLVDDIIKAQSKETEAEEIYQAEIQRRNSDSKVGDDAADYSLDPATKYKNCQKLQNLLQTNVRIAAIGKTHAEFVVKSLSDNVSPSWLSASRYEIETNYLIANLYLNRSWNGNVEDGQKFKTKSLEILETEYTNGLENLISSEDSKGREMLDTNIDAYSKQYKGLFTESVSMRDYGAIDPKSPAMMKDAPIAVIGPDKSGIPYYDADADKLNMTLPSGFDLWSTITESARKLRGQLIEAKRDVAKYTGQLKLITQFTSTKGELEKLKAILTKGNSEGFDVDSLILSEFGAADASKMLTDIQESLATAQDNLTAVIKERDLIVETQEKALTVENYLSSDLIKDNSYYLRYPKATINLSAVTSEYNWILVLDNSGTDPKVYAGIQSDLEGLDQFKTILNESKAGALEANGNSVLGKGVDEWDGCQAYIAEYEEKAEVTDTYSDVIEIALAGFGATAQSQRASLAKKIIQIPNASIAKALTQVKSIGYEGVAAAIEKAILKGQYHCFIEGFVEASVLKHLLADGYQVSEVMDNIDHSKGVTETRRDGINVVRTKDIATKIAWDGAIADYEKAEEGGWYNEWKTLKAIAAKVG